MRSRYGQKSTGGALTGCFAMLGVWGTIMLGVLLANIALFVGAVWVFFYIGKSFGAF
jgi:hypothetical protein